MLGSTGSMTSRLVERNRWGFLDAERSLFPFSFTLSPNLYTNEHYNPNMSATGTQTGAPAGAGE
jgi:hypothetical protein